MAGAYSGVILAGGMGVRMRPFSDKHPKPLLPVANRPLMLHQLELMAGLGIESVFVVVGPHREAIAAALGDGAPPGVEIRYVEQSKPMGIAHATGLLEQHIDHPFLLFLGDIYFVPDRLDRVFRMHKDRQLQAVLAARHEPDPAAIERNFAIHNGPDGLVARVIEKPRHARTTLKGCGIYLFDPVVFDAIRRTPRTALRNEYEITDSIQILVDDGYRVAAAEVVKEDLNLSTPNDLWRLNMAQVEANGGASIVDRSARIDSSAQLRHSVVGPGVEIAPGCRIENSLIFDGSKVTADLRDSILTPDGSVSCEAPVNAPLALVTGGAGFIGAALCEELLTAGWRVRVLDDLSVGESENLPEEIELLVGDVRDPDAVARALRGAVAVAHLAARVSIRASVQDFRDDFDTNLGGTLRLLEALPGTAVRKFVFASSMAVYADSPDGTPVSEDHATVPLSPYGAAKLASEHYVRLLCGQLGINWINLRYFNTYGPGQTYTPYVGVVTIFINRLLAGEAPLIFGDGQQLRDYVQVGDVARATRLALEAADTCGCFNIGTGQGRTVVEIAELLRRTLAPEVAPRHVEARAEELRCSVPDVRRAKAALGWQARTPELELEPVIEHWRSLKNRAER